MCFRLFKILKDFVSHKFKIILQKSIIKNMFISLEIYFNLEQWNYLLDLIH